MSESKKNLVTERGKPNSKIKTIRSSGRTLPFFDEFFIDKKYGNLKSLPVSINFEFLNS